MINEIHLIIVWHNAIQQIDKILADIAKDFDIKNVFKISWNQELFSENLTRFYGQSLPVGCDKEAHIGNGPFYAIIYCDANPVYETRETTKGALAVNAHAFDAKQKYRAWTGGGHKIHGTNTTDEALHDIWLLLGRDPCEFLVKDSWDGYIEPLETDLVGARGWQNIEELFATLNKLCRYVVLRNFEPLPYDYHLEEHGDIDLLVDDFDNCLYATNGKKVYDGINRVHYYVNIAGEDVPFDFRYVGDDYYDRVFQLDILAERELLHNCFFAPKQDIYFYSLLYHALIHKKSLSDDYAQRLYVLGKSIGVEFDKSSQHAFRILVTYLYKNDYSFVRPLDETVIFNERWVAAYNRPPLPTQKIADVISSASDISILSTELLINCTDELSSYYLSSTRANILRPFESILNDSSVLEVGASCGVTTRYLGECANKVLAFESSPKCASITRSRTRDLQNVTVVSGGFDSFDTTEHFDVITLIGVLDYAGLLTTSASPALSLLKRVKPLLKPGGKLIIGIDNQLSLNSFAGKSEVHSDEPMRGIEGRHQFHLHQSFGRKSFIEVLDEAGLNVTDFLAPFPNYRFPVSILTEQGVSHCAFDAAALASQSVGGGGQSPGPSSFSLELAWPEIFKNGLAMDMANSFLMLVSPVKQSAKLTEVLAYHYSTQRLPRYCKETRFVDNGDDGIAVQYRKLDSYVDSDNGNVPDGFLFSLPDFAPYIIGKPLIRDFVEIFSRPGWSIDDFATVLKKYFSAIKQITALRGVDYSNDISDVNLPGEFFDLLPQNIIVKSDGSFEQFDLEWVSIDPVPLDFLLFRALFVALGGVTGYAVPDDKRLTEWRYFIQEAMKILAIPISNEKYLSYLSTEIAFREKVSGAPAGTLEILSSYRLPGLRATSKRESEAMAQRDRAIAERDVALVEKDVVITERDAAVALINIMKNSRSWRLTGPLRFGGRLLRYGLLVQDRQRISGAVRKRYHRLPIPVPVKKALSFIYHRVFGKAVRYIRSRLTRVATFQPPTIKPAIRQGGLSDYVVWGVIDWHFRYQRPQQLSMALVNSGRRVFYVSPLLIDDERAGFEVEALDDSGLLFQIKLFVCGSPVIYSSAPADATISQLRRSMGEVLVWASCQKIVSLVQHPFWCDVASVLPNSRLVYDCMDHHEGFDNNADFMVELEKKLLSEAELTIITSTWLKDVVEPHAKRHALIRNAGDYEFFSKTPETIYKDPQGRRIIGYYGAIAEWFDLDIVAAVAKQHPECCVLLIGADTINAASRLKQLSNVTFIGEVPYSTLPYYLYSFEVCLLPFKVIELTLATNPVKAYEYLSAGKPVVAVDLPEMNQFDGMIYNAADSEQFLNAVATVLMRPEPDELINRRKIFAAAQTWGHRGEALIEHAESTLFEPQVSVIVVTYNNLELTKACLTSLDELSQYENYEIIVVDNSSGDGSPVFLEEWVSSGVNRKLILNSDNRGFAAANNQGLKIAAGDYLVMLNNDTYVTPGWIRTLMNHLQRDKSIGLIGPVTNNIGNESKIDINYADMVEMLVKSSAYTSRHIGETIPLRTAAFFCVMMPRKTYESVGVLDEIFGRGFFEDDDYCRRVEALGLRVVCAEDVFIHHQLSASFDKLKQKDRQKLFEDNKKIYEEKWGEWVPHSYRKFSQPVLTDSSVSHVFVDQQYVTGECIVCGKSSRFYYQDVALWRESLNCEYCRTTSRYRSIARGILRAIGEMTGEEASSLAALSHDSSKQLHIYDTQPPFYYEPCAYPLPDLLKATGWIVIELSQYKPDLPMGTILKKGVTNQNLECLTFDNESLDIIITSDVMEHVRLDDRAHREIHRVLKPGGIYIFTVPHNHAWDKTLIRVQITDQDNPSNDVHILEPEYHGDTNNSEGEGVLAYRTYGHDLEDYLNDLGFVVEYTREDFEQYGILNTELYYCRKTL